MDSRWLTWNADSNKNEQINRLTECIKEWLDELVSKLTDEWVNELRDDIWKNKGRLNHWMNVGINWKMNEEPKWEWKVWIYLLISVSVDNIENDFFGKITGR